MVPSKASSSRLTEPELSIIHLSGRIDKRARFEPRVGRRAETQIDQLHPRSIRSRRQFPEWKLIEFQKPVECGRLSSRVDRGSGFRCIVDPARRWIEVRPQVDRNIHDKILSNGDSPPAQ